MSVSRSLYHSKENKNLFIPGTHLGHPFSTKSNLVCVCVCVRACVRVLSLVDSVSANAAPRAEIVTKTSLSIL